MTFALLLENHRVSVTGANHSAHVMYPKNAHPLQAEVQIHPQPPLSAILQGSVKAVADDAAAHAVCTLTAFAQSGSPATAAAAVAAVVVVAAAAVGSHGKCPVMDICACLQQQHNHILVYPVISVENALDMLAQCAAHSAAT